jgi:hypothetical protein
MKKFTFLLAMGFIAFAVTAQTTLLEENFDDGIAATRWTIVEQGTSNTVNGAYDYINDGGLTAAPNGGGLGLKIIVNETEGAASQVLLFPNDPNSYTGKFTLSFDCWMNWTGDAGTTEFMIAGIQHTDQEVPNNTGIDFAITGDGGAAQDVRIYDEGVQIKIVDLEDPDTTSVYPAGSEDFGVGGDYYETAIGSELYAGMQWLEVDIMVNDDSAFFYVNDLLFARWPKLATDGNILIGYMDIWSSLAGEENNWIVYDNVMVVDNTTGISTITADFNVDIYPNPTQDYFNVRVPERSTFELYNTVGQLVHSEVVEGTATVDVSSFNDGMYIAKVTGGNGQVEIHKLVIK